MHFYSPIRIAVIGKIKGGKSTLLQALNTYAEERGIEENIDCYGIVEDSAAIYGTAIDYTKLELECGRSYYFYEFSHLRDFYKSVLSGFIKFDAALFVFNDQPSTVNHYAKSVAFLRKAGIKSVFCCFNVYDIDQCYVLNMNRKDYEFLLAAHGFDDYISKHLTLNFRECARGDSDELDKLKSLFDFIKSIEPSSPAPEEVRFTKRFDAEMYVFTSDESENTDALPTQSDIMFSGQRGFIDCSYEVEDTLWFGEYGTVQCTLDVPQSVSLGSSFYVINDDVVSAVAKITKLADA